MVYVLHKFQHYSLGGHFKMFTNNSTLKYLVDNLVSRGDIFRWILLFQEFDFEIVKSGRINVGLDHLPRLEIREEPTNLDDNLQDE